MFAARTLIKQSVQLIALARPLARSFSVNAPVRKDFVQELYLRELKAYKPNPAPSAAGSVKSYSNPTAPKAPAVPDAAALAKELDEYDSHAPAVDAPQASSSSVTESDETLGADDYLRQVEADVHVEGKH
ncbi:BQ5605_C017g08403 [Microbotryum silenes-dioicae]|uniref:BQ5605_C017g08403 protein n=1 Tax=Microbotryum silenes-dioicae TaxID=796604 RepID=A0A2X0NYV1_9BASI|nr:BQ5605_C017g08403 [Microbotryum silenes-dioicae]